MAMHHGLWITISQHLLMCKATDVAWNYLKKLVQGLVLYWLAVRFVAFFVASYVSQPRPIAGSSAVRSA
jgi:hypothetical protein